jgi:hypothetical protein
MVSSGRCVKPVLSVLREGLWEKILLRIFTGRIQKLLPVKKKKQKQNERDAACAGKVFGKIKIMPTGSFAKRSQKIIVEIYCSNCNDAASEIEVQNMLQLP